MATNRWTWPGPARMYEWLILVILYLAAYLSKSRFALAAVTALVICGVYLTLALQQNLKADDWSRFTYAVWVTRFAALGTGYWLYITAPTLAIWYAALLAYLALYVFSEGAAWHRKKTVEAH